MQVIHFVSYIEPELRTITPKLEHEVAEKFGLQRKYIYLPNQFWKHKNHVVAVKAIELLKSRGFWQIMILYLREILRITATRNISMN